MIKDCIEIFKNIPQNKRNKLIIDTYIPADGTYVLVKPTEDDFKISDVINIKKNKKTGEIEGRSNRNYFKFCELDYNSKLLEMNKPMDVKKIIHSNNYLSFFIKKENLFNKKLTNEVIDEFYDLLSEPEKKYSKKKGNDIYINIEKNIGKVDTNTLNKIKQWIKSNIFNLDKEITEGNDYLKIFFDYPIEDYLKEGKRYFIPNIYNSNDYNFTVQGKMFGLPNNNIGMNSKKPFLENKSRGLSLPYILNNKDVLIQKEFFDYLMNLASCGKNNVLINAENEKITGLKYGDLPDKDSHGILLNIIKGKKEAEIHNYHIINNFKVNLKKTFIYKDYIGISDKESNLFYEKYGDIHAVKHFQSILNDIFFDKYLIRNYFTEPEDLNISDNHIKRNLLLSRNSIFDFIWKGSEKNFYQILDDVSLNLVKGDLLRGFILKASNKFNLRLSLMDYKGGKNMADILSKTINSIKNKVNSDDYIALENDDEYYFAVGQIVSYLLSKHKGKNKPLSLAEPFINAKSNKVLKDNLRRLYKKYTYEPTCNNKRFKNFFVLVLGYEPEKKVNEDMMIAGFLSNNLVYIKEEKNHDEK
ncbi:CRISPR-associated protein Csh1 [Clostridium sp. DSM 8431]|uniref:type I-B CRISPR-associated protein Cas8b/Csh1 n=1 Tax=Clostridium sp. DSM 8431 TaxID=1761781 RepID=UPI0008F125D7|nr:type I-B CRISPR-associated protein Cas8b/Csh1 [Clostridium sp. DSM 8431]SFU78041.1 CRISPR-associated protein Csh1 [Clostridium sp. DSM 8431]